MRTARLLRLLMTVLAASIASNAGAEWPEKPVTMVMPYLAGGPGDIIARLAADDLRQRFGQPFLVENRPGASGNVGTGSVATSSPDGYTILFADDPGAPGGRIPSGTGGKEMRGEK